MITLSFIIYLFFSPHAGGRDSDGVEPPAPVAEDDASRQPRYVSGQYFFEYLVVVSLQKAKGSDSYEPQITYQFPKVGQWSEFQSEEEARPPI